MSDFSEFPLSDKLLDGAEALGFVKALPIQAEAIPAGIEGRDIIGCAPTGTGKTAAYLLPILDGLLQRKSFKFRPRALVLTPTRELAQQVADHAQALARFTKLRAAAVFGGVEHGEQERAFEGVVDLLVATPGRLLDHLSRGGLKLTDVDYFVLDEADRMLDKGFMPDLRRIVDALPERRQTMLFSATMPEEMSRLAREILNDPVTIRMGSGSTKEGIEERFYPVPEHQKSDMLRHVIQEEAASLDKVIVFVRTRAKARSLSELIAGLVDLPVSRLEAEMTQQERTAAISGFHSGEVKLLVATDVASRGLDIEGLSHVINFDVPNTPDDYIHRVGRTARVDRTGVAITFVSPAELSLATGIEVVLRRPIKTVRVPGFPYEMATESKGSVLFKAHRGQTESFTSRQPGQKEKPFTKSGHLRPKFQTAEDAKPRRKAKQRALKKILNKKLPHQRRRKG